MMRRFLARFPANPAIMLPLGALTTILLFVACGGGPTPTVEIERIEGASLFPGDEAKIEGSHLGLADKWLLGKEGSPFITVPHKGDDRRVFITITSGTSPGAYIVFFSLNETEAPSSTNRTIIVRERPGGTPPPEPIPPPTPTPTPAPPTPTLTPTITPTPTPVIADGPIVFAGLDWKSANIQNAIVRFIIEEGYGYPTKSVPGDSKTLWEALVDGFVDVYIEAWTGSLGKAFTEAEDSGDIFPLGNSLDDSWQSAFVVPTYVVEGDPGRGIEPMAPDLKIPQDIRKYQDLFATPATEPKARLVTCIASWVCSATNKDKVKAYGLEDVVQLVDPGSSDALFASLESSYANREPWVGYIWGPSQPAAELDLTLLKEPAYSPECWETDKGCAYAIEKVRKAVHPGMTRRAPDVVDFLRQWHFDGPTQVEAEAYAGELGVTIENTAVWYLRNKEEQWTQWVTPEAAEKVKEALQGK